MSKNGKSEKGGAPFGLGWYSVSEGGVPSWVPGARIPRGPKAPKTKATLTEALKASVKGNVLGERMLAVATGETEAKAGGKLDKALDRARGEVESLSPGARRLYERIREVMNR